MQYPNLLSLIIALVFLTVLESQIALMSMLLSYSMIRNTAIVFSPQNPGNCNSPNTWTSLLWILSSEVTPQRSPLSVLPKSMADEPRLVKAAGNGFLNILSFNCDSLEIRYSPHDATLFQDKVTFIFLEFLLEEIINVHLSAMAIRCNLILYVFYIQFTILRGLS